MTTTNLESSAQNDRSPTELMDVLTHIVDSLQMVADSVSPESDEDKHIVKAIQSLMAARHCLRSKKAL